MNQPSTACVEKEGWLEDALWNKTLVPGRSRGLSLKSNFPLMAALAERLGFVQEYRRRLKVIKAWGMIQSNYWEVQLGSQEASPEQRLF